MPGTDPQDFILFVTACDCSKMQRAFPGWTPAPEIRVALACTPAVYDWVNAPTDDLMALPTVSSRVFRLVYEQVIGQGRRLFTYREVL